MDVLCVVAGDMSVAQVEDLVQEYQDMTKAKVSFDLEERAIVAGEVRA